jgi:UDP-N-acetylmuramate--L-alanine ligase
MFMPSIILASGTISVMKLGEHIHIIGIAGHTMRGVALALKEHGYVVTGSDPGAYPPGSDWLDQHEIAWWREASVERLKGVSLVVLGGGVALDHPELVEAQKQGIQITSYPELVGKLVKKAKRIAVTGTHGKTTTTSLIAWVLEYNGRKPDFLIGIKPNNFNTSVRIKGSDLVVLEGDEYRSSVIDLSSKFKYYQPDVVIITSIEHDHPDLFSNLESVKERFIELVSSMPRSGRLYVCGNNEAVIDVAAQSSAPLTTYGDDAEWTAADIEYLPNGILYKLVRHAEVVGEIELPLYGYHNVLNSLAVAAVCMNEGIGFDGLKAAFLSFKGASRRFELVSAKGANISVIDDYAHHPTEVVATIEAAKRHFDGRVVVVFRPHTYSRVAALMKEFQKAFKLADRAYIVPIEGARENEGSSVSGVSIVDGAGDNTLYEPDRNNLIEGVVEFALKGDVVICMSVNGYDGIAQELARRLQ